MWLESPVIVTSIIIAILFLYAAPGLRLENGKANSFWRRISRSLGLGAIILASVVLSVIPAKAQFMELSTNESIQVTISMEYVKVRQGESIFYDTTVTNNGTGESAPLIVAMNLINLDAQGEIVDPEDWSPQRTQYIEDLSPGDSIVLNWRVNCILEGDYMIYMVVIPEPDGEYETSQPLASPGIHLIVTPYTKLNPGGVLPIAVGVPVLILVIIYFVNRRRRKQIDTGG
jgi:hypothetical protein